MEREKRITRMNSLTNALKYFEINGKKDITIEEVLKVAEKFFKWSWGEENVDFNEEENDLENPFD